MDGLHVVGVVGSAFEEGDDMVGLVGAGLSAQVADASVAADHLSGQLVLFPS